MNLTITEKVAGVDTTQLGPTWNGTLMSADEFDGIAEGESGYRYELINGVVIVSPAPGPGERDPNEELGFLLRTYQKQNASSKVFSLTLPEQELRLGENRRRCDRAIWCGLDRLPDPAVDMPQIVVEFVSATRRDRRRDYVIKRTEYLAAGVHEYWIIDRFTKTLTVCSGDTDKIFQAEQTYTTNLLPKFELGLTTLFTVADRWQS